VRSAKQLAAASGEKPDLVIVDLQAQKIDALTVPETFKAEGATPVQLLGFFSHVETELQRAAITAGYERVIPRSVFARDLAVILRGD
jgi:CheY-like chemotaxis protein